MEWWESDGGEDIQTPLDLGGLKTFPLERETGSHMGMRSSGEHRQPPSSLSPLPGNLTARRTPNTTSAMASNSRDEPFAQDRREVDLQTWGKSCCIESLDIPPGSHLPRL